MPYTLVGSTISPFVRKVAVLLQEKTVAYEHEDLNPFSPPDGFREISPLGLIPVLRHGDKVINDSSVICKYIERLEPETPMYPSDPYDCARAEWLEEYMDNGVVPVVGAKIFRPLVIDPLMKGTQPDEAAVQKEIDDKMPPFYDYLEAQIGDSGYFVGNQMTIADIAVAASFASARFAGVAPAPDRWPKLASFIKTMHSRKSIASLVTPLMGLIGQRWVEME